MFKSKLKYIVLLFIFLFVFSDNAYGMTDLSNEQVKSIEKIVEKQMKEGKIPGVSLVIVKDGRIAYQNGFGYANISTNQPVTSDTLFELGSTSKAFTALAILDLENKGKINLDDPVKKYIPWFAMRFEGEGKNKKNDNEAVITINHLLHHTSGIPFKTIGGISPGEGDGELEQTVKELVGQKLDSYPGKEFQYATINYDVLGLIIQYVSGMQYEDYMKENVLHLLDLNSTYLFREEAALHNMATGYKLRFLKPVEYDAPMYRGNTPAGYFITNSNDMAKWLNIQMGMGIPDGFDKNLISESHIPDRSVFPASDGSSYAYGWEVFQSGGGQIAHDGANPNFSSYIVFRPEEKLGVAVLANLNSSYTSEIGERVIDLFEGERDPKVVTDLYKSVDNISFTIVCIAIPVLLVSLYLLSLVFLQLYKRERKYSGKTAKTIVTIILLSLFLAVIAYCMYRIPEVLFWNLNWDFVTIWAPQSFIIAAISLLATIVVFSLYFILTNIFIKRNETLIFPTIILSISSGLGNAFIIFVINEVLNRNDGFQGGLFLYFILGIVVYVVGQKFVRARLVTYTNNIVFEKRINIINRILNTSYDKIEDIEKGKIQATLNNDTETISNFGNAIIGAITSFSTLLFCFIYLGTINLYGLLASIVVILLAAGLYYVVSHFANILWEQTRDIQNVFFKFINDMILGFKELSMNHARRTAFEEDVRDKSNIYRKKRTEGSLMFANAFVIGELLFTFVIGAVAFLFPLIFTEMQNSSLRSYVFVFLYMTGPVNGLLNTIPNIITIKISWNRLKDLSAQIETLSKDRPSRKDIAHDVLPVEVELRGVEYQYKQDGSKKFAVGPIDLRFNSGEIVFITGGNGSGKSTLVKLITGLYPIDSGDILWNGKKIEQEELNQKFAAVFSDFHLFEKLYGIEYQTLSQTIEDYLKLLDIDDKLNINNGVFSTLRLSTGQRKRVALLVSYLEDKSVYLFDEWAADQDPEFRHFFYHSLLPELKLKGKCVIAVTHDDSYFNVADRVIKMEMGKIEKQFK